LRANAYCRYDPGTAHRPLADHFGQKAILPQNRASMWDRRRGFHHVCAWKSLLKKATRFHRALPTRWRLQRTDSKALLATPKRFSGVRSSSSSGCGNGSKRGDIPFVMGRKIFPKPRLFFERFAPKNFKRVGYQKNAHWFLDQG